MSRRFVVAAAIALAVALFAALPALDAPHSSASAHPLGNFTVNRYSRIELSAAGVHVRYVIDMAEIPAFQEVQAIDLDRDGRVSDAESAAYLGRRLPEIAKNLDLRLNGSRVALSADPATANLAFPDGQGGLKTMRLVADYTGALTEGWQDGIRAAFKDSNYGDRIGWKEIIVRANEGVSLTESTAPAQDQSAELTAYPQDLLKSPLDMTQASFGFRAGSSALAHQPEVAAPVAKTSPSQQKSLTGFARLVERQNLTPAFVALSLLAAIAWGAAHALGPGHGKTIVGAYLVGSRGTARHALALGLTVTVTHTSSVVALGLVTLYASRFVATQDLYLWLSAASGVLVVFMGVALLWSRLRTVRRGGWSAALAHGHADHAHRNDEREHAHGGQHGHDHAHEAHGHSHLPAAPGWRGLVMLGISGGLLPCPTALVVMLGAIALDRIAYGMVLILAFSVGLAGVLTGIGILLVYAGRFFNAGPTTAGAPRSR
ncbi:MAG TPA: hypothetical protein VH951_13065, partial [Dehalococcoidia bacterium]